MTDTTMSAALEAAGIKQSMLTYYDLPEHLDEMLMPGELKARVFSSLAWAIDMQCINAARSVFYDVYKIYVEIMGVRTEENFERFLKAVSAGDNIDDFNFFEAAMCEQDHGKRVLGDMGLEQPAYATMVQLLSLRMPWHDMASKFAVSRPHEHVSLEERLLHEKQQELNSATRVNLQAMAEFVGDGDAEMTKRALNTLVASQEDRNRRAFDMARRTRPAIVAILKHGEREKYLGEDFGGKYQIDAPTVDEEVVFHNLPLRTQYQFIVGAQRGIERALSDLSSNRRFSVMEFATMLKEGGAAMKALGEIARNAKYANLDR